MKDISQRLLILLAILVLIVQIFLIRCDRKEEVKIETKKGEEKIVKVTQTVTIDSVVILKQIIKNTKPIIKWRTIKPIDTSEMQPNYVYLPCDSIVSQVDSGRVDGVEYRITDTLSGNRIIGRKIELNIHQLTINKDTFNKIESLRVDTVYITRNKPLGTNLKWFLRGIGCGAVLGYVLPK